jgi:hypothetical protein
MSERTGANDPLAQFRVCDCLSCRIVLTVLEHQTQRHGGLWKPAETLQGLATAAAFFCRAIIKQSSGDPVGDLHTLVAAKMAEPVPPQEPDDGLPINGTVH